MSGEEEISDRLSLTERILESDSLECSAILEKGGEVMKGIEIALFIIGCGVKLAEIIAEED